jgi:hypothetical protein
MTIEAHDPHHLPQADLRDKGLSHNAVGLIGGTVLGSRPWRPRTP